METLACRHGNHPASRIQLIVIKKITPEASTGFRG